MISVSVNTSQAQGQIVLETPQGMDEVVWEKSGSHSEVLTREFQNLLLRNSVDIDQVKKIYCVVGPGSFTGVRVAVNFCKALAMKNDLPIVAIDSLDLFAYQTKDQQTPVYAILDAQKNSVFVAKYRWENQTLFRESEDLVVPISVIHNSIEKGSIVCGNAHQRYEEIQQQISKGHFLFEEVWSFADLKIYQEKKTSHDHFETWKSLTPHYIKASAPEELRKASKKQY